MPTTFGDLLRGLRKRNGMTQSDLAAAAGYSISLISRLEANERLPDAEAILARFVPALGLQNETQTVARLLELAAHARGERPPASVTVTRQTQIIVAEEPDDNGALPIPPTPLIGRDADAETICNRLLGHHGRLLTLVGPPGIGKTRLALEAAHRLRYIYSEGAVFISLATVEEPSGLAPALMTGLGVIDDDANPAPARLIQHLRRREILLVLDNFEHVLPSSTPATPAAGHDALELVADLLAACPHLRILATSRERLHLRAEQRFRVPPLPPPAAIALFVQRAQAVEPSFALTPANQPAVAEICRRLDGLPLAIELVAAQIDTFAPAALLARLRSHHLDLMTDGPSDLPSRHRSLRTAIFTSYVRLPAPEQQLFRALGVFGGGFELDAIEHMGLTAELVPKLVHKSLIHIETSFDSERPRRYGMLETLRAFSVEQWAIADDEPIWRDRHAAWASHLAETLARSAESEKATWLDRLEREHDNLAAALRWLSTHPIERGLQLAGALLEFWHKRGHYAEGRAWLDRFLAAAPAPTLNRARALVAAGQLAADQGDFAAARTLGEAGLHLYRELGDAAGVAWALCELGILANITEQPDLSVRLLGESIELYQASGNDSGIARSLSAMVHVLIANSIDIEIAHRYLQQSQELAQRLGATEPLALAVVRQGTFEMLSGHYATAEILLAQAAELFCRLGNWRELAWALEEWGEACWFLSRWDDAAAHYAEARALFHEHEDRLGVAIVDFHFAQIDGVRGDWASAGRKYAAHLGEWLDMANQKMLARCFVGLGASSLAAGDAATAARFLGAANQLFAALPPFLAPADQAELDQIIARTRACLDAATFESAWRAGRTAPVETLIASVPA